MLLTVATTLKCLVAYLLQILRPCTTENSKLPPPFNKGSIVERQQQTLSFRLSPPGNEWLTRMDAPTFFQCRLYCYSARRSRKRSLMWLRGLALFFVIVSCVDRFFRCPRGIHIAQPPPLPHTTLLRQHLNDCVRNAQFRFIFVFVIGGVPSLFCACRLRTVDTHIFFFPHLDLRQPHGRKKNRRPPSSPPTSSSTILEKAFSSSSMWIFDGEEKLSHLPPLLPKRRFHYAEAFCISKFGNTPKKRILLILQSQKIQRRNHRIIRRILRPPTKHQTLHPLPRHMHPQSNLPPLLRNRQSFILVR